MPMLKPVATMGTEETAEQQQKDKAKEKKHEGTFRVGQRVIFCAVNVKEKDPQLGTVRYVGPVQGQQGIWVGVDWDSGDGRHDGFLDGVRYFQACLSTSASFVRPHLLSAGCTLLHAITSRYKVNSDPSEEGKVSHQIFQGDVSSADAKSFQFVDQLNSQLAELVTWFMHFV
ncbi:hypothetical protein L7F22_063507 [Adiantum nelumboides]|nr:hypothetical protein [Adiantum nelumboides]